MMASEDQAMPETALDSITVMGFKSIASVEALPLRPINVIIGANGSGKSNFLGVFAFLHAIREGRLQEYVRRAGGAEQILHFGSRVTQEIHVWLSFRGDMNRYGLSLAPTDDDSLYIRSQSAPFADQTSFPKPYVSVELSSREPELQPRIAEFAARRSGREAEISNPAATGMAARVGERFNRWHLYHMNDTSAAAPVRKTAQVNAAQRGDDPACLEAQKVRPVFRCIGALRRIATFHGAGHALSSARSAPPFRDPGR